MRLGWLLTSDERYLPSRWPPASSSAGTWAGPWPWGIVMQELSLEPQEPYTVSVVVVPNSQLGRLRLGD